MSHAVKKIANAVERGNLRGIDGMAICIHMLKDVYMASPDMVTMGEYTNI